MNLTKARFLVNARGNRTGVILTMDECHRTLDQLDELEAFRQQGLVWVPVDRTTDAFVDDKATALELAPQPHRAREIIVDALEGRAARYVTDEDGKRLGVILSSREYDTACDALDDLEDIKTMQERDAARLRGDPDEETIPIEQAFAEIDRQGA